MGLPHENGEHYRHFWYVLFNLGLEERDLLATAHNHVHSVLAAMGATFALTEGVVANHRQTDDAINGMAGGCAAGFLAGVRGVFFP
jgi:hypothetical protein